MNTVTTVHSWDQYPLRGMLLRPPTRIRGRSSTMQRPAFGLEPTSPHSRSHGSELAQHGIVRPLQAHKPRPPGRLMRGNRHLRQMVHGSSMDTRVATRRSRPVTWTHSVVAGMIRGGAPTELLAVLSQLHERTLHSSRLEQDLRARGMPPADVRGQQCSASVFREQLPRRSCWPSR